MEALKSDLLVLAVAYSAHHSIFWHVPDNNLDLGHIEPYMQRFSVEIDLPTCDCIYHIDSYVPFYT